MATTTYSCVIQVREKLKEGGYWSVTSKDLPGLFLGGTDIDAIREEVPEAIRLLFELNYGMKVDVRRNTDVAAIAKRVPPEFLGVPHAWTAAPVNHNAA